jgi:hypothetical protein
MPFIANCQRWLDSDLKILQSAGQHSKNDRNLGYSKGMLITSTLVLSFQSFYLYILESNSSPRTIIILFKLYGVAQSTVKTIDSLQLDSIETLFADLITRHWASPDSPSS